MRTLALLVVAACGSSSRPTPAPDPVANKAEVVPDAAPDVPMESGEGTDADLWVARGEAMLAPQDGDASAAALALFRQACEQGHPRGCQLVGETLISWQYYAISQDDAEAARAYDRSCRLDQAHACYRYGFYVLEGLIDYLVDDGELRPARYGDDDDFARQLVHRGCDLGDADACARIQEDPRLK